MSLLKKLLRALGLGLLVGLGVALFFNYLLADLIDRVEYLTYYQRSQWSLGDPSAAQKQELEQQEPDVCIIDIDDRSLQRMGPYSSWNRSYHAQLLRSLQRHFPAAVGFDVMFDVPDDQNQRNRVAKLFDSASARSHGMSSAAAQAVLGTIDYDQQLIQATRASGGVFHAIRMAQRGDYDAHVLSTVEARTTEAWHDSLLPSSTITLCDTGRFRLLERKQVLDGIFPALAQAAAGIGHVDVPPNEDGVVRAVPLLFRFDSTQHVYPALSVRMTAALFGTPMSEIAVAPGRCLDIGSPFKVFRDSAGVLRCSYPNMSMEQVHLILDNAERVRSWTSKEAQRLSTFAVLEADLAGKAQLRTYAGVFPAPVYAALLGADLQAVRGLAEGGELDLGGGAKVSRVDEENWTLSAPVGEGEWYLTDVYWSTFEAIKRYYPGAAPGAMPRLLFYPLEFRRWRSDFVSSIPVLRNRTLGDLCGATWDELQRLPPGGRREFGNHVRVPLTADNRHIITFFGPQKQTFKYLGYYDAMEDRVQGGWLPGKVFLVGSTAPGLFDLVHAPLSEKFPGVEVHASLIRSFLTDTFVRRLTPLGDLVVLVSIAGFIGFLSFMLKPAFGAIVSVVGVVGYVLAAMGLFDTYHLWVEMARPILTIILTYSAVMALRYITEERDRKFLQATFKQYLAPQLIDRMYREKKFPKLGGEENVCTCFFTDIQGFSTFSEKLGSPTRLVELLNEYLSEMTDILLANNGTLDKYEGDAIIAFFGAPMPSADHARQACATALGMQRALEELRGRWKSQGDKWPAIVHDMRMRIGINSGPIVTGNMGSKVRMNYTMMGDPVNLAARLEGAAKQYGVYTMVSDKTYAMVEDAYEARQLDKIRVVGKSEPITVYELLGEKGSLAPQVRSLVDTYSRGLDLYNAQAWDEAISTLTAAEAMEPLRLVAPGGMSPSRKLILYCQNLKQRPPGPEWDGVAVLTEKG